LLADQERALVELMRQPKVRQKHLATLMGTSSGNFSRRIRKILNRLDDPIAAALEDPGCSLDPAHRTLGLDYFLRGCSVNDLARARGISVERVRGMIEFVRGWFRGSAT